MQKSNEKKKLEAELPLHLSQTKENIIQSCLNRLYDEILDINESDLKDEKTAKKLMLKLILPFTFRIFFNKCLNEKCQYIFSQKNSGINIDTINTIKEFLEEKFRSYHIENSPSISKGNKNFNIPLYNFNIKDDIDQYLMDLIHALYITIKKNDIKYISQILSNVIKNWSKDFTECIKNKKFFRYCETKKIIEDFFIEIFNSTDIKQSNTHNISLTDAIMQYSVQHNKPFNKSIFIDLPKKKLQNINTNNDKLRQHLTKLTNSNKKDNTKELIEQEIESTFQEMNKKFNYDKISSLEKKLSKEQKDLIEAIKLANKQIESKNNLNVLENVFLNTHPDTELIAPKNNFDENKILEKDLTEYIKRVNVDEKYDVGNAFTRKINTDKRRNYRIVTTIENYLNQVLPQYEKLTLRDQSQNKAYVENEIEYRVEQLYKKKQEDSKNYKPLLALESEKKQDKANDSRFGS